MVAVQYVLTTLAFAAPTRYEQLSLAPSDAARKPGLRFLLKDAQERGLISNSRFAPRKRRASIRANERKGFEVVRAMQAQGVQEQVWEFSDSDVRPEDWEDMAVACDRSIAQASKRSCSRHADAVLHCTGHFETVHDLIPQLWAASSVCAETPNVST